MGDSFLLRLKTRLDTRLAILLIATVGIVLYINTLSNQMFWDDFDNILNNQFVQNWRYLPKLFTENLIAGAGLMNNYWRPLLLLAWSIQWHLWGSWAPGYHFVNAAFHITNAILLFHILRRCLLHRELKKMRNWIAFLTSLLFLTHPAQTEAVTYISSLADPLSTLFIFSGILLYLKFRVSRPSPLIAYYLSLFAYILALMIKEAAIIMPLLVLIMDFLFTDTHLEVKKRLRESIKRLWPFFGIASVYVLLRATVLNFGGTFNLYEENKNLFAASLTVRILTFFRVFIEYLKIIFLPIHLHAERTVEIATSILYFDVVFGGLILLGLLAIAFTRVKRHPILSFGILWFLIGLAPTSNIAVPINNLIMEHWLYLPIIGVSMILVWLGAEITQRWSFLKKPLLAVLVVTITFLSVQTIKRNRDWRDPVTFYNQTLQYAPNSYRIINNLGMAYADMNDHEKAEETYQRAITVDPTNPVAYHNLGNTYKETGRRELAIENFQKAIELDPEFAFSYNSLANLYLEEGNYREARRIFEVYLNYSPSKADTLFLLAQIAAEEGDLNGALAYLKEAQTFNPENQTIRTSITQLERLIKPKTE